MKNKTAVSQKLLNKEKKSKKFKKKIKNLEKKSKNLEKKSKNLEKKSKLKLNLFKQVIQKLL